MLYDSTSQTHSFIYFNSFYLVASVIPDIF